MAKIGIIGGSGLEKLNIFRETKEIDVDTQYGKPSSTLYTGKIGNNEIAILSRHGRNHTIPPTQINNRANIIALKDWGTEMIIATTACGSLRENIGRGHIVVADQFIDFTKHRINTFYEKFEEGKMGHTPMADPFDKELSELIYVTAKELNLNVHKGGTIITIEGPRFSTRAESFMFRAWGADIINMSTAPEVTLANEAGIPYAVIALCTDYDCWKTDEEPVSWEAVLEIFHQNINNITNLLVEVIKKI